MIKGNDLFDVIMWAYDEIDVCELVSDFFTSSTFKGLQNFESIVSQQENISFLQFYNGVIKKLDIFRVSLGLGPIICEYI